jgi:hypothetical protein
VVLTSEPLCLCGVDVAAPHEARPGGRPLRGVLELLRTSFADAEWQLLQDLWDNQAALQAAFQCMWACKEVRCCRGNAQWCAALYMAVYGGLGLSCLGLSCLRRVARCVTSLLGHPPSNKLAALLSTCCVAGVHQSAW